MAGYCISCKHGRAYGCCCGKGYMAICGNLDNKLKWEPLRKSKENEKYYCSNCGKGKHSATSHICK